MVKLVNIQHAQFKYYKLRHLCIAAMFTGVMLSTKATAEPANIPAGPLGKALSTYASQNGVLLSFEPAKTEGKETKGLKGNYSTQEGFKELLKGTGLEIINDQRGGYYLDKATPPAPVKENIPSLGEKPKEFKLDKIQVRAKRFHEIGPLPGLGLTKEEIPGNVQSITAKEIKESHSLSLTDLMNKKLQSVNVNDYQGNPFQMDVTYRGFTAGPQIGTPQGLSVFLDGIRVNEPFGDVVNWDMIPMNAIAGVDVFPGSNPIFGLGTLGGAFTVKTKDGFTNEGVDAEILAGSYGRKQLQLSGGVNNGTFALFGAGNFFLEDGWRDNSPSKVNQMFGKASYRGDKLDLNLSTLLVSNELVGNGLLPSQMYEQNRSGVFTSPDTTKNTLLQFQLAGAFQVSDNFSITGQAYRRDSKRKTLGADVYTGYEANDWKAFKLSGDHTCLFASHNANGFPDFYVVDLVDPTDANTTPFFNDYNNTGTLNSGQTASLLTLNQMPTDDVGKLALDYALQEYNLNKNFDQSTLFVPQGVVGSFIPPADPTTYANSGGEPSYLFQSADNNLSQLKEPGSLSFYSPNRHYYWTADPNDPTLGIKHVIVVVPPVNSDTCVGGNSSGQGSALFIDPDTGYANIPVDGAFATTEDQLKGVVEGTPTAVLTNTEIDQIIDGASVQLNWNLEHHKFMVGASIDRPTAQYTSGQKLGLLDAQRNAYLAPDQIREQYAAAISEVHNNDFTGYSITKSIYASETWSPIETLHITGSARYNDTHGKNKIATRSAGFAVIDLARFGAYPDDYNSCPNGICTGIPTGFKQPDLTKLLNPAETEKFSYYSLNPSFGLSWQAKNNLNLYGNWSQGTRTPSVIELGCAFDNRPSGSFQLDSNGNLVPIPKSIADNRSCNLPSTLSGDPYLPQIQAQTIEIGARGQWGSNLEWNLNAYQTNLKDDIYFVAFGDGRSFFDTIGKTRRQGLEAGLSGAYGKAKFKFNYALTDATFQDSFQLLSENNSSSDGTFIQVNPGNRMPGVSLHNLNATFSYDLTPKWSVGITAIAHSDSYVRGNENNKHQTGVVQNRLVRIIDPITNQSTDVYMPRQATTNPGTVPGYATFNFSTSYKLAPEWTLGMQVNNLFDKEFFSAGRLGRNPFSPKINGDIGPDGYNHNSNDWLSTNFIAPSAPRGVWFSLNWQFDGKKDKLTSDSATLTEPSEVEKPYQPLPPSLHRYQGTPQVEE